MASPIALIVQQARAQMSETVAAYWTDTEVVAIVNNGIRDLWRRLNDLYQDYFVTIDDTNVTLAANSTQLSGVPSDLFRVVAIEPRVVGSSNPNPGLVFQPRPYNHPEFVQARAQDPRNPSGCIVFYTVMQQGAPVSAPVIFTGPQLSSAVDLRVVYNQTLSAVGLDGYNPIPGESDNALVAWTVAYMRAKERDDASPDPEWLAIYATEKNNLVVQLTPRQIQEPAVAEAFFADLW